MNNKNLLSLIPSVDSLLNRPEALAWQQMYDRAVVKEELQQSIDAVKKRILSDDKTVPTTREELAEIVLQKTERHLHALFAPSLRPVINATGIILHTGLGRAPLSRAARENVMKVIAGYSNLEIDVDTGKRGQRNDHVSQLLCRLTGAEAAVVVNNNAAAVFLALNTMASGKEAIISRGQLIEIGGSFRMPDVMEKSGVIMREVGTTNKTKLSDYEKAINPDTGVIVVAHTSNYRVLGFTAQVDIGELTELAHAHNIPVLHDLGGGVIVNLQDYGLPYEPLVQDSLRADVDVVTFSGDKILGGPQSGILVGKKEWIGKIHANPIMRAVRCDKMTFAALEPTLKLFLRQNFIREHRTLRMLTEGEAVLKQRAEKLLNSLSGPVKEMYAIALEKSEGQTGSGALPLEKIPSLAITLKPKSRSAEWLAGKMRANEPPVFGYIKNDKLYLDMRTVDDAEIEILAAAVNTLHEGA